MKTTQPAVQATAFTPLVPQILLESMEQIRVAHAKISAYYVANEQYHDCIQSNYSAIDRGLNDVASEIAEMMRTEMLERTFYAKPNQESEACNA